MPTPTPVKTWIISPNNRITYVSLADTLQRYLFGIKEFLKTNGFTVKGSASAGVGAMDGVDRWTTSANVTPRGANASSSQAWIVLTNGGGVDISFCYQGSTDDVGRLAWSPSGVYVAAGTPQNQPTATDEVADHLATTSLVGNQTSGDRIWNAFTTSDRKMIRVSTARAGTWIPALGNVGKVWCIEEYTPVMTSPWAPTSVACPTWMYVAQGANTLPNGTQIGRTRITGANGSMICALYFGVESIPVNGVTSGWSTTFGNEIPALQGGAGYALFPLGIWTQETGPNARGKVGQLIDVYMSRTSGDVSGDTYGSKAWINAPGYNGVAGGGGIWPWDGVTTPIIT